MKFGLGMIRLKDGLPTMKSLAFTTLFMKSQIEADERVTEKKIPLTKDI